MKLIYSFLEGIIWRYEGDEAASLHKQQAYQVTPHLAGVWENASTPSLTHLFMSKPSGLSAGKSEKWLEIYTTNWRRKDFTTLSISRIRQTCRGWSKSFAWIPGHSCKENLFLGTFTDRPVIIYSLLQRLHYEQDNPTLATVTFQMKSWSVSTSPSLERTITLPELSTGEHTGQGSFCVLTMLCSVQEPSSYFPSSVH